MAPLDAAKKTDLRRGPRHAVTGNVRITWQDSTLAKACIAKIANVSATGLGLRMSQAIPNLSYVYCIDPTQRVNRRGWVRYCKPRQSGYELGIEWTEPVRPSLRDRTAARID